MSQSTKSKDPWKKEKELAKRTGCTPGEARAAFKMRPDLLTRSRQPHYRGYTLDQLLATYKSPVKGTESNGHAKSESGVLKQLSQVHNICSQYDKEDLDNIVEAVEQVGGVETFREMETQLEQLQLA
jgi:hypothetical protein